ncbi:MAG: sensor histidine kinase [Xanthomonadales bacterium]
MTRRSLAARIVALTGVWIAIALVAAGIMLWSFYQSHVEEHYDAHVRMHMEEMVAAARLNSDGSLTLAYQPSDPRYQILHSGWYWEIRQRGRILARSPSLGEDEIKLPEKSFSENRDAVILMGPADKELRVQTRLVPAGSSGEQLLLVSSAPMTRVTDDVDHIVEHMVPTLALLAGVLLIAVVFQVRLTLRPINDISRGISAIHQGRDERISGEFPVEIQPLVDELNNLVEHNATLLRRARNQLGDLAHSIKNPLTVINNEARSMDSDKGRLILARTGDIQDSVDHHLTRARASGTTNVLGARVKIRAVAEDLVFALQRIYQDRKLRFNLDDIRQCAVRCEAQDLEEMLGNLMDNACKWARSEVAVSCRPSNGDTLVTVEDDGPGIPADEISRVMQRGQRLDESTQGHGLGLGIIQDIVELYNGKLELGVSKLGGLRADLTLPGG